MPKVYNRRDHETPTGAIYVGRPSLWGNHVRLLSEKDRPKVMAEYRRWIYAPEQAGFRALIRRELKGKDLECWCVPADCHATVLLEVANGPEEALAPGSLPYPSTVSGPRKAIQQMFGLLENMERVAGASVADEAGDLSSGDHRPGGWA